MLDGPICGSISEERGFPVVLISYVASLFDREEGQGLAEYALILALIAVVCIVALIFLGSQISSIINTVGTSI